MCSRKLRALVFGAVTLCATVAGASRASAEPSCTRVGRADVVACARRASLVVEADRHGQDAARGRRLAQSPLFPSNPVLTLTGARREGDGRTVTNWSAALEQQVEIAGQRSARQRAAEADLDAQGHRVEATRREAAAHALTAYFDALAADEELRLSTRLSGVAAQIANVARAMADRGLVSPVEADVADAARVSTDQAMLAAERHARTSRVALAVLLGGSGEAPVDVAGELEPLRDVEEDARRAAGQAAEARPEVQMLLAERRGHEASATAFGRARVPNLTVSAFAQNDGFNEHVLGLGLALPLPLPQPVGRLYTGEIAEQNALAARAGSLAEVARRQARAGVLAALADYDTRRRERAAFTKERTDRAQQGVEAIAREIENGRLPLRDALVAQQALIGLLRAGVEARHTLCLASVDLARAASLPLERGVR